MHEKFMRLAITEAHNSKTPFGAVIVQGDDVVVQAGNTVRTDDDPTCHAEVNAIRKLAQRLGKASTDGEYTLYTTCEPCAMCAATCLWANLTQIVYGVGAADFSDGNPNMIDIRCEEVFQKTPKSYSLKGGILREDCLKLHEQFPIEDL